MAYFSKIFKNLIKKSVWILVLRFYKIWINKYTQNRKVFPIDYPLKSHQYYSNNNCNSVYNKKLLLPYCDLKLVDRQNLHIPFECNEVTKLKKFQFKKISFEESNFIILPIAVVQDNYKEELIEFRFTIEFLDQREEVQLIYFNRFHYLPLKAKNKFNSIKVIASNMDLTIGKPIINFPKEDNKLVVHILLDAFPQALLEKFGYGIMPNTLKFFGEKGIFFKNAFAQAEWTLSSMASIFTGKYTNEHLVYRPRSFDQITDKTIADKLSENGFKTFACSNIPKLNPISGFDKGFDRFIQATSKDANYIIGEAIEQLRSFNGKQYLFLGFFETHEAHKIQPLSVQTSSNINDFNFKKIIGSSKSISANYDNEKINFLKGCINNLDLKLKSLYDQIDAYDDQAIIILHSDHGVNFMSKTKGLLGKEREKVLFIYKNNKQRLYENKVMEIRKIPNILFSDLNIDLFQEEQNLDYAITESIYPGKNYEIAVRSAKHVLFFFITWNQLKEKNSNYFWTKFHSIDNEELEINKDCLEYKELLKISLNHCNKTFLNLK